MLLTVYCVRRDLSEVTFSLQVDADFELHNFRALCELESGIPAAESQVRRGSERGLQPLRPGSWGGGGRRVLQPPVDAPTAARGARARAGSPPHLLAFGSPGSSSRTSCLSNQKYQFGSLGERRWPGFAYLDRFNMRSVPGRRQICSWK